MLSMRRRWTVMLGAVAALACVAGPSPADAQTPTLTIYAAADLAFAFEQLVPLFEKSMAVKVTPVLGSTGNLAKQIENGAPADLFFAANESFVDELIAKDAVIPETRALYAQGRVVLATAKVAGPKLVDLRGLLDPRIRKVAIANPEHAPYG
jgi:molybdate transport system substrate-binding protein